MRTLALLSLLMVSVTAHAQQRRTRHARSLPPPASIADVAFVAGHWQGEGLGGLNEEVWTAPWAGTMMGMYRHLRNNKIAFYEILTLTEEAGSLVLRLKHFNPDLTGWEEKAEVVSFALVALTEQAAYFDGLTFERAGPDSLVVHVALAEKDGVVQEETFRYHRKGAPVPPKTRSETTPSRGRRLWVPSP